MHLRAVWCVALAACHVRSTTEITRPATTKRISHPEGAIARRPTLVLTDAGAFRFVEPLECPTEEIITTERAYEVVTGPNLATFVVGVIATAAGGILTVKGMSDDDNVNGYTIVGAATLAVGLPFAIGPWIGNGKEIRAADPLDISRLPSVGSRDPLETTRRPGPAEPCGERALSAKHATLTVRGIEVFGRVAADGTFGVSPYQLVDAFEASSMTSAWDIAANVEATGGARTVGVVIDGRALASRAPAFLKSADFDTKTEPMRLVPGVVPGTLRVSLTSTPDGAAARIVLAVKNDGPGPAFALRGHITAPGTPALDGRIMYFGQLAKNAAVTRELLIPISPTAADALRNATIDLALELRDAHGTAPTTPVKFRGPILVDAPR